MTLYAAALRLLGLSQAEAAAFHGVRLDTIKSWSAGRNRVPPGAWAELRALYGRMQAAVDAALAIVDESAGDGTYQIHIADNDEWPSPGVLNAIRATIMLESAAVAIEA